MLASRFSHKGGLLLQLLLFLHPPILYSIYPSLTLYFSFFSFSSSKSFFTSSSTFSFSSSSYIFLSFIQFLLHLLLLLIIFFIQVLLVLLLLLLQIPTLVFTLFPSGNSHPTLSSPSVTLTLNPAFLPSSPPRPPLSSSNFTTSPALLSPRPRPPHLGLLFLFHHPCL